MNDENNRTSESDQELLRQLGIHLAAARLDRNLTQQDVAERAGIGKRTIERIEQGESTTTLNLVRVLRALDRLSVLAALAPDPGPSPLAQLRAERSVRRRASSPRQRSGPRRMSGRSTEPGHPFRWGDESDSDSS